MHWAAIEIVPIDGATPDPPLLIDFDFSLSILFLAISEYFCMFIVPVAGNNGVAIIWPPNQRQIKMQVE